MKKEIQREPIQNPLAKFFILGVGTAGGLGYVPKAPGTAGSLMGIPLGIALLQYPAWISLGICALLFIPSVWISDRCSRHWGESDSGKIVIDEVLGQAIAILGLWKWVEGKWNFTDFPWIMIAVAFGLFRLLDIVKPFPAKTFDRQASGFGVMADDVVAGVYAALIVRGIGRILLNS